RLYDIEDTANKYHEEFGTQVLSGGEGEIDICDMTYSYDREEVLKSVYINIPANEVTAIIGESGSGKTTLLDLILGVYSGNSGEIKINGCLIENISEQSLRNYVAIVSQQHFLFNASVFENFKYVNKDITLETVQKICRECQMHTMIENLPDKYNTVIYENGNNFSIGQLQRLNIARALAKNAQIILFDEPTSALDATSTEKIKQIINKLRCHKTIVIVSHDMRFIENADKIYKIANGTATQIQEGDKHYGRN
ncbi:MAG: ABC transporter ATP-binding protein, partial [Longicatena sp.]